jgi:hypothetical protein
MPCAISKLWRSRCGADRRKARTLNCRKLGFTVTDQDVLRIVEAAFPGVPRPEHFTNFTHCEECAECDVLLLSRDYSSLTVADVGNPGADPLSFCSGQGKAHFMPALARLALDPPTYEFGWYGTQLLFHLGYKGCANATLAYCTAEQMMLGTAVGGPPLLGKLKGIGGEG